MKITWASECLWCEKETRGAAERASMLPRPSGCRRGPRGSAGRTRRGCARALAAAGAAPTDGIPGPMEGRGSGVDVGMRGPVRGRAQGLHRPSVWGWAGQGRTGQDRARSAPRTAPPWSPRGGGSGWAAPAAAASSSPGFSAGKDRS